MSAPLLAVVDTNVVVSGLISRDAGSPSAIILDRMLSGELRFVASVALLAEYRAVLLRPRIRTFHRLGEADVDRILRRIVTHAALREPVAAPAAAPDPGDQLLWDLLAAQPGAVLVTGDGALLGDSPPGIEVVTPREFVERLDRDRR